jgi:hypothetical protein
MDTNFRFSAAFSARNPALSARSSTFSDRSPALSTRSSAFSVSSSEILAVSASTRADNPFNQSQQLVIRRTLRPDPIHLKIIPRQRPCSRQTRREPAGQPNP